MRNSLYWDDFNRRIQETASCLITGKNLPIRRCAIFVTEKCNFRCSYCNGKFNGGEMTKEVFANIVAKYKDTAILHITGGEPSTISWLYSYIDNTPNVRFHLNTNAFIAPPKNIQRLKVSLDSDSKTYFDKLVKVAGAFEQVISHIKKATEYCKVSITCVLSKETYKNAPNLMRFCRESFPDLYAVFFSIYKGTNKRFIIEPVDADIFFDKVKPRLEREMDNESLSLLNETTNKKMRIIQGVRFPENKAGDKCFISMSEKCINWDGSESCCSHLFRDGILSNTPVKYKQCEYGCNPRLVMFNEEVEKLTPSANDDGCY